jgi:hypothetical protein
MDYVGRDYSGDNPNEAMEMHLSHLKLINVPTMFDIGCTQADPTSDSLTLCMLDSATAKIVKQHVGARSAGRESSDIERIRQQLQAIHTNMQVSQVNIEFDSQNPMIIGGGAKEQNDFTLTIDNERLHHNKKVLKICKISVSRLLKSDLTQASIPIMTFLPLKEGELKNQTMKSYL